MTEPLAASTRAELCSGLRALRETFALASHEAEILCAFLSRTIDALTIGDPEVVICSALRLPDGRIFRGHRHGDCVNTAYAVLTWNRGENPGHHHWDPSMGFDQGFITSRNRYVDRKEGMRLQLAAGIDSVAPGGYRGQLFSEDLY